MIKQTTDERIQALLMDMASRWVKVDGQLDVDTAQELLLAAESLASALQAHLFRSMMGARHAQR